MKNQKVFLLIAVVAATVIGAVVYRARQLCSVEPALLNPQSAEVAAQPESPQIQAPIARAAPRSVVAPSQPTAGQPALTSEPINPGRVRADQVLARVNGKPVQLKDLVPLGPEETEKSMTQEHYESRLNRAIETELTFQAASAQQVGLTGEQQQRLNKIVERHEAKLKEYKQQRISWSSITSAQLEFEKRLTSALMLQQNLAAKEAGVAPSPDAGVQVRYEQALREILARLKSNANISTSSSAW